MNFIDITGHIFSLPSYDDIPLHLKYKEGDYVFWLKDQELSINNYYILPIRLIINVNDVRYIIEDESVEDPFKLNISLESNFYKLIGPKYIQEKLEQNNSIKENIEIDFEEAKSELTIDDFYFDNIDPNNNLIVESGTDKYFLFPFYVIGNCNIEGTILSNIMIKTSYKEEKFSKKEVFYTRDELYNYFLKKTTTDIKIYEYNPETEEETLWYTLRTGYNSNVEILYPYFEEGDNSQYSTIIHSSLDTEELEENKANHWYRVRNWGTQGMHYDVYHYIYKIPQDKWLQKGHYYRFEGEIFQSCKYCGSTLLCNHDGYEEATPFNPAQYPLLKHDGTPYYPEDFTYNNETGTYIPHDECRFIHDACGAITTSHTYGEGFKYTNNYIQLATDIRDFYFDVDNNELVNAKNGTIIEEKTLKDIDEYCQITVGGTFIDEQEELVINGRNMGIHLPKEIIRSIYSSDFYHKYPNEKIFKDKMKELLLNYMSIKGECGNFKSVYNSLKWFGWGDKIEISKLIKTDNEFQNQFILDYFDLTLDIKEIYRFFNPTNMISLSVKGNEEASNDIQNYSKSLIGEGKPIMKDLFDEVVEVNYDGVTFYKPYYDFVFTEMALKLDCLKYYYQQYFLPIHIKINRASIDYKVYANTVKMTAIGFEKQTEAPLFIPNQNLKVIFPEEHELLYYKSEHFIDDKFNEFNVYNKKYTNEDLYYVNENCIVIPIKILDMNNQYSQSNTGDLLKLDDGSYVTPYMYVNNKGEEVPYEEATYYVLNQGDEGEFFDPQYRYRKITTQYFNCKIYITYTVKKQDDLGHYVYKDGEYLYKEKFYNDLGEEDEKGKYTYFWGNHTLEYVPEKNRYTIDMNNLLYFDNSFNYYQTGNLFYKNFIIIPRLLKNKTIDWLNTDFRMSVLVNNTWFTYDFRVKIPNLYLDFGKLEYRYFVPGTDDLTMFNQLSYMSDEIIKFRAFMYQPDLISINALFEDPDKLDSDETNTVLTFLERIRKTNRETVSEQEEAMYSFYNQYYRKKIKIPYNKNYYNQIHLFKIKSNMNGIDHIIKLEGYSLAIGESWEEWSPYNGGENNIIKGWRNYLSDLLEEYPNAIIRFYRDDTHLDTINISNLLTYYNMTHENIEYKLPELDNEDGSINKFDILDDNEIIETLCRYNGCAFEYLYNKNNIKVNHTHVNLYWYDLNKINDNYSLPSADQLIYNENTDYTLNRQNVIKLYQNFFNSDGSLKFTINEKVPYDFYLMHDPIKQGKQAYWYGVLISKYPISNYKKEELKIQTPNYTIGENYQLIYEGTSVEKFLINRMDIVRSYGFNHFNTDDLIIATIHNNDYQFNIDLTNKWTNNLIYDLSGKNITKSNSNIMIIPNNNANGLYTPGYYNLLLNYSINGLNDQSFLAKGYYRVEETFTNINYDLYKYDEVEEEVRVVDIRDVISDFTIIYENDEGDRIKSTDVLDPEDGYHPFGIKIMNQGYYGREQKWSIYIGLKHLSVNNPDQGFSEGGPQNTNDIPYFGFYNIDIPTLTNYNKICYTDSTKTKAITYGYPQTDFKARNLVDSEGNWIYPADNYGMRGFRYDPLGANKNSNINMLNDDDTLNWDILDETCAASDWDGYTNTQKMIEAFGDEFDGWKTSETITNVYNQNFSPMAACAWRYHTRSTHQGDWYIPSYAEVFFLSYNYQRLTELFAAIAEKYPNDCKTDLLECLSVSETYGGANQALWTSTECNSYSTWEIHVTGHAHSLGKNTSWSSFPYIRIED